MMRQRATALLAGLLTVMAFGGLAGAVVAKKAEPAYMRPKLETKTRNVKRASVTSRILGRRTETHLAVRKPQLTFTLKPGEELLEFDSYAESWKDGARWARDDGKGGRTVRLDEGEYDLIDAKGQRYFSVATPRRQEKAPKPPTKAKRYDVKPLLFAERPTSKSAIAFDRGLVTLLAQLTTRGPLVSKDAGGYVHSAARNVQELEGAVRQGRVRRRVTTRKDGTVVATYVPTSERWTYDGGTVTLARPGTGRRALGVAVNGQSHQIEWSQGAAGNALDVTHIRNRETHHTREVAGPGGAITGQSRFSGHDFDVHYTVDRMGGQVKEKYVRDADKPAAN